MSVRAPKRNLQAWLEVLLLFIDPVSGMPDDGHDCFSLFTAHQHEYAFMEANMTSRQDKEKVNTHGESHDNP